MRFYIADCHFGHDKVRLLDGRPFASVEEMDEAMIVRWNERVRKKKDEVVILGVLCLGKGEQVNELLHQYGDYIIGRMGLPYREKGVNIISVAMDAPGDVISALSGKLGRLEGVTAKTVYAPAGSV